ncbi:MAG: sulfur reduction protein DsrS [Gammaproteobacteria bacterium]|nr:sulfur reduction protein DsrS [Gammaproteobacteria bacterium]
MELASEDSLRLHVLLKNVEAIRIDENSLSVYGLSERGEAKVALNPNCRPDRYLKAVREFLSGAVLGSPGGYPLHLNRWTRMGQARDANLAELLLLGEPEAVSAVAHAVGLSDELARRVWWIAPTSENARRMLERAAVVSGTMGRILAAHLVEHLAFETDPYLMIESVRRVLQPGLIDAATRQNLWDKGAKQPAYRVGFLAALPHDLPGPRAARADSNEPQAALAPLLAGGNPFARLMAQTLSGPGQDFLDACQAALQRPSQQAVVVAVLNVLGEYFQAARAGAPNARDIADIVRVAEQSVASATDIPALAELLHGAPALAAECRALVALSHVSEAAVTDILARTTAEGSLLRRKLEPATAPVLAALATLRGAS